MTAMSSIADVTIAEQATMPRFEDGFINLQEVLRQLAESIVNEIMSAEADQLCEATGNSRNGYRERSLVTCVGTLALRIPKLRAGSFFPDDVLERYQRVDRAIVAAVSEMYATGAVMCDMDEGWQEARYFSRQKMDELYDESSAARAEEEPTPERLNVWRLVAKRAIDASLELADELEAA